MYKSLLIHQIRAFLRSSVWQRNLFLNFLMILVILYFAGIFLLMGFILDDLLTSLFPQKDSIDTLSRYILVYLLADFLSRFLMQGLPVLKIQPYLHLPIKRASLVHNILLRSLLGSFSLLPLLLLIPFILSVYETTGQLLMMSIWVLHIMITIGISTLVVTWLKRYMVQNSKIIWGMLPLLFLVSYSGYAGIIPWLDWSEWFFTGILKGNPLGLGLSVLMLSAVYIYNYRFLLSQIYPELYFKEKKVLAGENNFLNKLSGKGLVGMFMLNEIKLILRNKRPKSVMMLSLFFCFYGLIFYVNKSYSSYSTMFLFAGIFTTGAFMIQYGQFLISWEAAYLDGMFSRPLELKAWLQAKFWLMSGSVLILFILSLPFAWFFGISILKINTACALFNLGFNSFVMLTAATYNKKRVDLSKGSSFNWQGVGASQWLVGIPVLFVPIIIYFPFTLFEAYDAAILTISGIGLLSMSLYKGWISIIIKNTTDRKFDTLTGFRQNN